MKIRNYLAITLVILMLISIVGCKNTTNEDSMQLLENTNQGTSLEHEEKIDFQETNISYGKVTDPVELEKLWQEYLYDTIGNIGNIDEFNSAAEIDPIYIADYCQLRYVAEHGTEGLEPVSEEYSSIRLLPLDTVLEYAKRYFNLTSLDVTKIDDSHYDSEKRAFICPYSADRNRPPYTGSNNRSIYIYLDKVIKNHNGTVTAVLVERDRRHSDRIIWTMTYTLKQREDGSMYFVSGKREYINNNLVSITGDYQRFDRITGLEGYMPYQYLTMIDEIDDRLIMLYTPYQEGKNAILMHVNLNTMTVEKKLELNDETESGNVSLKGENIIVRYKDKYEIFDKNLEKKGSYPLPKAITDKINREPKYNEKHFAVVYFGGYDVSIDGTKFVYTDEEGLKLYNTIDGSEKLLSKSVPITDSELIDFSYHYAPRFVAGERKVITTMSGYECTMGYTLYDLENDTIRTYDIVGSEGLSTHLIRYDTGLMEINTYIWGKDGEPGKYKTIYLDFATGECHEIHLEDRGVPHIVMPGELYVGRNFAAFITIHQYPNDPAKNTTYYIQRLNLKTMQLETKVVTVKGAGTNISGVLADGRIVFWYFLNPSEQGICITR